MEKKFRLLLLLVLLMTAATGAWAQGPVDGTIAWSVGDEASATVSASIKDAISSTGVTTGSGLTVSTGHYFNTNMVRYQPATANAGNVSGVMIEYTIEAGDGYKFKPTGVDYAAVKDGSDLISYSWSYTIDGVESAITDVSKDDVLRNTGNNSATAQLMHSESITADGCSVFTLRFYISNCSTTKKIGIGNITISGSVSAAPAPAGYTVSLKDGVKDADKWTVKVGEGEAQALPIGGLKGDGSETVTLQYTGRLKVKGVKATSDAAPAGKTDLLSGVFSVSASKKVNFSKGNLQATYDGSNWTWAFANNQWDYIGNSAGNTKVTDASPFISENGTVDLFGWVGASSTWDGVNQYGITSSKARNVTNGYGNSATENLKKDWGAMMGTGWFTLSKDEWTYLLNTRSASNVGGTDNGRYAKAKVNDVQGIILFPDTYTHPDGVTAPTGVNATGNTGWNGNSYTVADWTKMETAGCVFLPAAGSRDGNSVSSAGTTGSYWWSTHYEGGGDAVERAYNLYFANTYLLPTAGSYRNLGCSVRLVQATTEPSAEKPAATVTTAPTGAAVVGVGKTTALVSGGVADGGTLMYAVTTTNTKPTSTDGFSDAVPTAKDITASGTVYVWYYVKADDSHSDSEIAATAIEVPVADIVWDVTNVSDINVEGMESYEKEGVRLSANSSEIYAWVDNDNNPTTDGIVLIVYETGGFTFTAPTGKAFTKIEMKANGHSGWNDANLGTGWAFNAGTATWKGTAAASTVGLLTDEDDFDGPKAIYIAFYLSE